MHDALYNDNSDAHNGYETRCFEQHYNNPKFPLCADPSGHVTSDACWEEADLLPPVDRMTDRCKENPSDLQLKPLIRKRMLLLINQNYEWCSGFVFQIIFYILGVYGM